MNTNTKSNTNGGGSRDKNRELMLAMGSKNGAYDADAPDQWKYDLRHGEAEVRAMAWVKSKTIAFGHESPFCVDEHGKPVGAEHMAVELGWELQTARNVLSGLSVQGRIRIEKGKRIWYCADVPKAYEPAEEDEPDDDPEEEEPVSGGRQPRPKVDELYSVQSIWGTYVADFIRNLPRSLGIPAKTKLDACVKWKQEFFADGMAALRTITERVEDTTLLEIGVPKKRLEKRRPEKCKWVQLSLLAEPNFVQGISVEVAVNSVHGTEPGLYEVKNGSYKPKPLATSLYTATTTAKPLAAVSVSQSSTDRPTESPAPITTPGTIHALLLEALGKKLPGEIPSANLCKRIAAKLQDAPPELLKERIKNRRAAITSMGMVENLAEDVGKRWVEDQAIRQSGREPSRADNVAYLRREWAHISEDERAGYLREFPELRETAKGAAS